MRRRDPVKRAIMGAIGVVVLMAFWIGANYVRLSKATSAMNEQQAKFDGLEKGFKTAQANEKLTGELKAKQQSLQELASIRVLWAPMLDALQKSIVTNVSVMRVRTMQNYQFTEAVKAKPGTTVKAKPAKSTESVSIVIDARDYGDPSQQNYTRFKDSIANNEFFKKMIPNPNNIKLKELSPPQSDPLDSTRSFQAFSIECRFPDKEREAGH